mgnify:CR=1 FL=1
MVSIGINMNTQINIRFPEKVLVLAKNYAKEKGCGTSQDFIKEIVREKLFDEPEMKKRELKLVNSLFEISEKKNLYGTEKELFKKLKR